MSEDNNLDSKKNFPNSFVWLLLAAFFFALMVQNLFETKMANVSFSYELEHLVNLQMIQPEDSKKIALNDNLVTFNGKFRDRQTAEGKNRYKFLELLNGQHELERQQEHLEQDLVSQKQRSERAASYFLQLSGQALPIEGYVVVEDPSKAANSVVIKQSPKTRNDNLASLEKASTQLSSQTNTVDQARVSAFGAQLLELIKAYRSPDLGVGAESLKQSLKAIEESVLNAQSAQPEAKVEIYHQAIAQLKEVTQELNRVENNARLGQLRAIRTYRDTLDQLDQLAVKIEDNGLQLDKARQAVNQVVWFFNGKELSTRALEKQDSESYGQWFANAKEEWDNFAHNQGGWFRAPDQPLNPVLEKTFKSEQPAPNYLNYLFTMIPVLLALMILYFIFSRQMRGIGNSAMSFGKAPARMIGKGASKITFKDVAGVDEAVEELQEIVEFLKSPQKFTALGGRIPKGVLCIGPPGTGKTLLAKAIAGEADRPFFSISGSDFVEMFVGVGASRIRDLFDQAKKSAPCIIFIDEIDAVGRHRGPGVGGGHDEREQTLNQLLVEMDGFDTNEGVILMAATNRPDVLDKALLRPGRFDRRVVISLPDIKGRYDILKVHARKIKLDPTVDLMLLARSTPGCSGADLGNILNESALLAARRGRPAITAAEVSEARDKVLYGKERRSLEIDENEKMTTAYHEAGHAIVGLKVKHSDPIDKITIIPRGMSLGATMFMPKKNRTSYWKNELLDQLAVLMGGRCAEEIFVHDISSGARQDIERATNLARSMVCEWGMSDKMGPVSYEDRSEPGPYGSTGDRKYSEEKARDIDSEVHTLLNEAHAKATSIIKENEALVQELTKWLRQFETLSIEDVNDIMESRFDPEKKLISLKIISESQKPTPKDDSPESPEEFGDGDSSKSTTIAPSAI